MLSLFQASDNGRQDRTDSHGTFFSWHYERDNGREPLAYLMERTKRARRLKPPQENDVTHSWKAGADLQAWVSEAFRSHWEARFA
jgi:hypothetical protein